MLSISSGGPLPPPSLRRDKRTARGIIAHYRVIFARKSLVLSNYPMPYSEKEVAQLNNLRIHTLSIGYKGK